jgi:hypothetical protein
VCPSKTGSSPAPRRAPQPGRARAAEPDLADDGLLSLVADNTGTPLRLVRAAVRYWASYPDEIDAEIAAADAAEYAAEQAWHREHQLLAR